MHRPPNPPKQECAENEAMELSPMEGEEEEKEIITAKKSRVGPKVVTSPSSNAGRKIVTSPASKEALKKFHCYAAITANDQIEGRGLWKPVGPASRRRYTRPLLSRKKTNA